MSYNIRRINNLKVIPPKLRQSKESGKPVKGRMIYNETSYITFILAKKKSGKTVLLFNILHNSIDKRTKVFIFCSSISKDQTYKGMLEYLDKKNIEVETFTNIRELTDIIKELFSGSDDEDSEEEKEVKIDLFKEEEKKDKKKKYKNRVPDYVFIFDDLGTELRDRTFNKLLKTHRHINSQIIISSHYPTDLMPEALKQIDLFLLLPKINEKKLLDLYDLITLDIDYEKFQELYKEATEERFNFLYVDARNDQYRFNFNHLITFNNE